MTTADAPHHPSGARLLALATVGTVWAAAAAVATLAASSAPSIVWDAVTLDLVVTATLLFWWLGVRRGRMPALILAPVFLVGLGLAHALVGPHDPVVLRAVGPAAVLVELGLAAAILIGVGRAAGAVGDGATDPLEDIRARVRRSVGEGLISRLLASELSALWFATVGWRRPVPGYGGARILSYHRGTGAFYGSLLGISAVELVAVHLLVSRWSMLAAVGLGLLGIYGACWILADLRAARLRPITLDDEALVVRTGLRWTIRIPRDRITSIGKPDWRRRFGTGPGELNAAVMGAVDLVVEVREPVVAVGAFGIRREVTRVGIALDEPGELV